MIDFWERFFGSPAYGGGISRFTPGGGTFPPSSNSDRPGSDFSNNWEMQRSFGQGGTGYRDDLGHPLWQDDGISGFSDPRDTDPYINPTFPQGQDPGMAYNPDQGFPMGFGTGPFGLVGDPKVYDLNEMQDLVSSLRSSSPGSLPNPPPDEAAAPYIPYGQPQPIPGFELPFYPDTGTQLGELDNPNGPAPTPGMETIGWIPSSGMPPGQDVNYGGEPYYPGSQSPTFTDRFPANPYPGPANETFDLPTQNPPNDFGFESGNSPFFTPMPPDMGNDVYGPTYGTDIFPDLSDAFNLPPNEGNYPVPVFDNTGLFPPVGPDSNAWGDIIISGDNPGRYVPPWEGDTGSAPPVTPPDQSWGEPDFGGFTGTPVDTSGNFEFGVNQDTGIPIEPEPLPGTPDYLRQPDDTGGAPAVTSDVPYGVDPGVERNPAPWYPGRPDVTWAGNKNVYGTPPTKPGLLQQLGQTTNWANTGKIVVNAAGNIVDATGKVLGAVSDFAQKAGKTVSDFLGQEGNYLPDYLASIGYHEMDTGEMVPGGVTGPTIGAFDIGAQGAGQGGGSYFHGGASAGLQHGATSVAGATTGYSSTVTDLRRFLRSGRASNLGGRLIPGQYMPSNFRPFSSMPTVSAAQFMAARNPGSGAGLTQNAQAGLRPVPTGIAQARNPGQPSHLPFRSPV